MKHAKYGFILGLIGLMVVGCQNQKNPLSISVLQRQNPGVEKRVVIQKLDQFQTEPVDVQMGRSSALYIGTAGGYSSSILLKFSSFGTIPDTATIDKVILRFKPFEVLNPAKKTFMTVNVYPAQSDWQEREVKLGDLATVPLGTPVISAELTPQTDAYDSLLIPPDLVKGWKDSTIENNGLLLTSPTDAFIKGFYARESTSPPVLFVFFQRNGSPDSAFVTCEKDVSLPKDNQGDILGLLKNPLMIGDGIGFAASLKFTLPDLPTDATIHRATLRLAIDTTASLLSANRSYSLTKAMMKDEGGVLQPDSTEIDSTSLSTSRDHLSVDVTNFVQKWVSGKHANNGLRLAPRYFGLDIFRAVFFTDKSDSVLKPTVLIYYSLPAQK
ncbi:MAG: DNRLRE domain-containing protein [Calditrichaeota bacterium]|nr:DNRLRE domain-containing protein [Calditrichota bacterium]